MPHGGHYFDVANLDNLLWDPWAVSRSHSRQPVLHIATGSSNNGQFCVVIYQVHLFHLIMFGFLVLLVDAAQIHPEISEPQLDSNPNSISKGVGERD